MRLVMMNSEKQVRMRCRVIRHQATAYDAAADRLDGGGDADDGGDGGQPVNEGGVLGELDPAGDQAPERTVSGVHHQMARMTGQADDDGSGDKRR